MLPQHSDTAFIPCLNLCWCIHKAGQECATGTHRSGNQSFLPSALLHGSSNSHREMAVSSRSRLRLFFFPFVSVDLNPSAPGAPFGSYLRNGAFPQTHLYCRTNKLLVLSKHTLRELQASLVCSGWPSCPNTSHITSNMIWWVFIWV